MFWNKIGLSSKKDVDEIKDTLTAIADSLEAIGKVYEEHDRKIHILHDKLADLVNMQVESEKKIISLISNNSIEGMQLVNNVEESMLRDSGKKERNLLKRLEKIDCSLDNIQDFNESVIGKEILVNIVNNARNNALSTEKKLKIIENGINLLLINGIISDAEDVAAILREKVI